MFEPIIHNLKQNDVRFIECQHYNTLIANKPKGNYSLEMKTKKQRMWKLMCQQALTAAHDALSKE